MTAATRTRIGVILAATLALELACRMGIVPRLVLIAPSEMFASMVRLLGDPAMLRSLGFTLSVVIVSTLLSALLGMLAGLVIHSVPRLREIVAGPVYVNLIDAPDGPLARGVHAILDGLYPHVVAVRGPTSARGRGNVLLAASRTPLAALDTLPEGYARYRPAPARAFTDNRGWVGHR